MGAAASTVMISAANAQPIISVELIEPTNRYAHGAMGPLVSDHGALRLGLADGTARTHRLPQSRVFEDNQARLADIDGDGAAEVVVVEADQTRGARLTVYDAEGLRAAGPFIGRRNRWMAVSAIADLDGDGRVEIAVVDRPHLRKTLVIWREQGGRLVPVAEWPGVTNHRFGAPQIDGGLRDCSQGSARSPELVLSLSDWSRVAVVRFTGEGFEQRVLPFVPDALGFARALGCDDG